MPISWDEYFMSVCLLSEKRSKDPSTQVGACIVNDKNHIIGIGYNGFPNNCNDNDLPWTKNNKNWLDNKYAYVVHSEMNAIMNCNSKLTDKCRLYVSLFPCNECAKIIIQSGIKKIIYKNINENNIDINLASKKLLDLAGVTYTQYISTNKTITLNL